MKNIKWSKIIDEKREEIETALKQAKRDSYNRNMSGWLTSVELDEDSAWVNGLMSENSQSMTSYNGDSIVIHSFESWVLEVDTENMTEEEIEEEIEFVINEEDYYDIIEREISLVGQNERQKELDSQFNLFE